MRFGVRGMGLGYFFRSWGSGLGVWDVGLWASEKQDRNRTAQACAAMKDPSGDGLGLGFHVRTDTRVPFLLWGFLPNNRKGLLRLSENTGM